MGAQMKLCQKIACAWLLPAALCLVPPAVSAHDEDREKDQVVAPASRVLGQIGFPTTTDSPEAQAAFIQGMLLLHLFEYPFAREQFQLAQQFDPDLAIAYWGEAMTHNHPIWDRQELPAARAVLMKLGATPEERLARTPAAREKGLLAAVELLYGDGAKAERDQAYLRAMEQLAAEHPEDHEIQLFYALALFGVQAGVRDTATYMLCTAIAQDVFNANPQHPGAAHYLIHGVDDPLHAVLGLRAARALAVMAPDAGHSQHMTSHIFIALGMWDDMVGANEAAVKVQNAMRGEQGMAARHWGHYNYWLLYGYLQQGRDGAARELLEAAFGEAKADGKAPADRLQLDPDSHLVGSVVQMWARYVIETRGWTSAAAEWSFNSGDAFDPNLNISFVKALQAAYGGLAAQAGQFHQQFSGLAARLRQEIGGQEEPAPTDLLYLDRLEVMERELLAAIEMARGDMSLAVSHAREASRLEGEMPHSYGPPFVDLPAAEFLGDLLLASGKHADAAAAYELQLERSRLKARPLTGLVEALDKLGRDSEARYHRERFERLRRETTPTPPSK
jgi:tetratricopeptide (TPR) repeat protein